MIGSYRLRRSKTKYKERSKRRGKEAKSWKLQTHSITWCAIARSNRIRLSEVAPLFLTILFLRLIHVIISRTVLGGSRVLTVVFFAVGMLVHLWQKTSSTISGRFKSHLLIEPLDKLVGAARSVISPLPLRSCHYFMDSRRNQNWNVRIEC